MTIKQKLFVKKYLENNGNGTKAALEAYDTNSPTVAHSIASENLRKPTIQQAIQQALEAEGVSPSFVIEQLKEAMLAGKGVKATNADTLRAIDIYARLTGSYEAQIVEQSYRVRLTQMPIKDLVIELEEKQKLASELLREIKETKS